MVQWLTVDCNAATFTNLTAEAVASFLSSVKTIITVSHSKTLDHAL